MNAIINDLLYDTDVSEQVLPPRNAADAPLYRTKNGRWFLIYGYKPKIYPATEDNAKLRLSEHLELYEKFFGKPANA